MVKKLISILVIGAMTACAGMAIAGSAPQTGVNGSWHDITYLGQATGAIYKQDDFQRVCIFCHTPHNAQQLGDETGVPAPLWNHDISTVNLAPYTWAAPANLPITFDIDPLVGPSRLCMSCHDGVTAVDSHGPDTGVGTAQGNNNGNTALRGPGRFIDNLSVTHPIGFQYQEAFDTRGDQELIDISTGAKFIANVPDGNTGAGPDTKLRTGWTYNTKKIADTMYSGYVTCASCHDVHNTNNAINDAPVSGGFAPNYFVWSKEKNSALCLSCHVK